MRASERLKLASLSYVRAIGLARAEPTPAAWTRLLAAARNLRQARRDVAARAPGRPGSPEHRPAPARAVATLRPGAPGRAAASPVAGGASGPWPGRAALEAEWERSRRLMEESTRLVQETCALRATMAALLAEWRLARGGLQRA